MDAPPGTNNALKRRRVDEETQPRAQEAVNRALTAGYQAGYGYYTGPTAVQQFYSAPVSQWASTTPQPNIRPTGSGNSVMLSCSNPRNPYHNFLSQGTIESLVQDIGYQAAVAKPQQPSTALASSSFKLWSSAVVRQPMPQQPAQKYTPILPESPYQQRTAAPTQAAPSRQSWKSVVCADTEFPRTNTPSALNNSVAAAPTPAWPVYKEQCIEKVCFGMVSRLNSLAH